MTSNGMLGVDLTGKLAVVVGGNQGIGAAIGTGLAKAGCRVVLAARDKQRLTEAKAGIEAVSSAEVSTQIVDLTDVESIHALATAVLADQGTPTILVNSAGGALHKSILDVTPDDWDQLMDTHLRGTFFVCQAFGRAMIDARYGKIINLSSTWASTITAGRSVYAAAKAGLSHLTAALAVEWASAQICVNAIAPTTTTTPRVLDRMASDPEHLTFASSRIPMGRLATPEDIVGAALFLASPASDFVTGHTLYVDGGWQHSK